MTVDTPDRMAADAQAMSDRLGQLRASGTDDNDLASVTVDANGALVDIRFTSRIQRVAPSAVEQAVMAALRSARSLADRQARDIIAETMGPDSVAAQTIATRIERQLSDD
jgi:DNA-binding protein YbaB